MKSPNEDGWVTGSQLREMARRRGVLNGHAPTETTAPEVLARGPPQPDEAVVKAQRAPAAGFYTQVPNVAFELPARLGFDVSVFSVLMQLCRLTYGMKNSNLTVSIGLQKLAERACVSKSSVATALNVLEQHKLIQRSRRTDSSGRQASTTIHMTLPEA